MSKKAFKTKMKMQAKSRAMMRRSMTKTWKKLTGTMPRKYRKANNRRSKAKEKMNYSLDNNLIKNNILILLIMRKTVNNNLNGILKTLNSNLKKTINIPIQQKNLKKLKPSKKILKK